MSDESQRKYAAHLTGEAARIITSERANAHGSAENSFQMIAQYWSTHLTHSNIMRHSNAVGFICVDQEDVAEMMSLLKKARKVHGRQGEPDNYIDDIGYTALGGAMSIEKNADMKATAGPAPDVNYAGMAAGAAPGQGYTPVDPSSYDRMYMSSYAPYFTLTESEYKEWCHFKAMQSSGPHRLNPGIDAGAECKPSNPYSGSKINR